MAKIIVHIDLNAFYVRCEEIKNPSLENKAVAIGHEGRGGVISTCSYEARKYGVCSGMPTFKAKKMCPHLILIDGDYRFYSLMSKTFFNFVRSYTNKVEVASIDECFADFTDVLKNKNDPISFFKNMQQTLYAKTGLRCSIGVSTTRFLAKMASDYQKPMGLTIIRKKDIANIIYPLKIESLFGVGKKTAPRLKAIGINTINDLYMKMNNGDPEVKNILGKFYETLKDWLDGKGSDEIEKEKEDPKSIGNSITLPYDMSEIENVDHYLLYLAKEVSARIKAEDKLAYTVQIVIKDITFKSFNKSLTLENPICDYEDVYQVARKLYIQNFNNIMIRLVGITLQNLIDIKDMAVQMSLFDYEKYEQSSATKLLINEINRNLKKPLLKRASEVKKDGNS